MHSHEVHWLQKVFTRLITKGHQQIAVLQSLPIHWQAILNKVLISILGTLIIPLILAISFSILLTLVFAIPAVIMCIRWFSIISPEDSKIGAGDMKVPTYHASESARASEISRDGVAVIFCMPIVGVVFGGIHCVGWYFNFPSSAEAITVNPARPVFHLLR